MAMTRSLIFLSLVLSFLTGCSSTKDWKKDYTERLVASEKVQRFSGLKEALDYHQKTLDYLLMSLDHSSDPRVLLVDYFNSAYRENKDHIYRLIREKSLGEDWPLDREVNHHVKRILAAYQAFQNLGIVVQGSVIVELSGEDSDKLFKHLASGINQIRERGTQYNPTSDYKAEAYLYLSLELTNLVRNLYDDYFDTNKYKVAGSRYKKKRSRVKNTKEYNVFKQLSILKQKLANIIIEKQNQDESDLTGIWKVKEDLEDLRSQTTSFWGWRYLKRNLADISIPVGSDINGFHTSQEASLSIMMGFELVKTIIEGNQLQF